MKATNIFVVVSLSISFSQTDPIERPSVSIICQANREMSSVMGVDLSPDARVPILLQALSGSLTSGSTLPSPAPVAPSASASIASSTSMNSVGGGGVQQQQQPASGDEAAGGGAFLTSLKGEHCSI